MPNYKLSKEKRKKIERIAYLVAFVQPVMVAPQIWEIFQNGSAEDVSLLTWSTLLVFNSFNLLYGYAFNIKPLIINNSLWIIADALVVIGVLVYG